MRSVLRRLLAGELTEEEALSEIRRAQLEELGGHARLDLGRRLRRGIPEVVLAEGKQPVEAARLVLALAESQGQGLMSRLTDAHREALATAVAENPVEVVDYARAVRLVWKGFTGGRLDARCAVICAGTSDLPVVGEVRMMLDAVGVEHREVADVGVAGLHRLLEPLAEVVEWKADVVVVAAGMDGVLPGVVAGLVSAPVIGVPVSTGYGLGGGGEAALLTMLQSCATGLLTVNIDNGIGAGAAASLIAARVDAARQSRPAPEPQMPAQR